MVPEWQSFIERSGWWTIRWIIVVSFAERKLDSTRSCRFWSSSFLQNDIVWIINIPLRWHITSIYSPSNICIVPCVRKYWRFVKSFIPFRRTQLLARVTISLYIIYSNMRFFKIYWQIFQMLQLLLKRLILISNFEHLYNLCLTKKMRKIITIPFYKIIYCVNITKEINYFK